MVYTNKCCPNCGKAYEIMTPKNEKKYGCPITTCRFCGEQFLATNVIEPATIDEDLTRPKKVSGLSIFLIIVGILLFSLGFLNSEMASLFFIIGGLMLAGGIFIAIEEYVNYEKNIKQWKIEMRDSQIRMQNIDYALILYNAGYEIPKRYLKSNT